MRAPRKAGGLGCGGGPARLFSLRRLAQARVRQQRESDHRRQRVSVRTIPGTCLEMPDAEFLLSLLVRPLAGPARFDDTRPVLEAGGGG
jgi:hypothetical protein